MKTNKYLFLTLFLMLCMMGQSQVDRVEEVYPLIKNKEVKNFSIRKGVYDLAFKLTDNESWNIKISIPEIAEGETVPLIIALHWAGDQNTYQEFFDCLALPALDTLNGIIIAPSSDGLHWLHPKNEKRVINLIRKIIKYWPISSDQVLITGYSNGAIGGWDYTKKQPKLFSAGILLAGSYDDSKIEIPVYIAHGENDELFSCREIESTIHQSIEKGSKIDFQIVNDKSHFMACDYVDVLREKALKVKHEVFKG